MWIIKLLEENETAIKQRWLDLIIDTYPADSRKFFKKQKNQFSNPVGHAISGTIGEIYEALLKGSLSNSPKNMEEFVKIRAIQEFSPAQAVGFILFLKQAIRGILEGTIQTKQQYEELLMIESEIDKLTLYIFDAYMNARESLFNIKIREIKYQSNSIIKAKTTESIDSEGD